MRRGFTGIKLLLFLYLLPCNRISSSRVAAVVELAVVVEGVVIRRGLLVL
jgi:hypothetical protein